MIHYSQIIIEHRVDWQLSARVTLGVMDDNNSAHTCIVQLEDSHLV